MIHRGVKLDRLLRGAELGNGRGQPFEQHASEFRQQDFPGIVRRPIGPPHIVDRNRDGDAAAHRVHSTNVASQPVQRPGLAGNLAAGRVASNAFLILLTFENRDHLPGSFGAGHFSGFELLKEGHHVTRRADAQSEWTELLHQTLAAVARRRPAAEDLAQRSSLFEAELVDFGVDEIGGDAVEDEIGRGVIADHDHQIHQVAQRQLHAARHFAENSRAGDFVFLAQLDSLIPFRFPLRYRGKYGCHDRKLNRARGSYLLILTEAI